MFKILFICLGNICRSPMAEFVLKDLVRKEGLQQQFFIASAATSREEIGNDVHYGTKAKLREVGVPIQRRRAVQLRREDYEAYDHLIAMDGQNVKNIFRIIGEDPKGKVRRLLEFAGQQRDIADPWYTGNFDKTYDDILLGCQALLETLRNPS